MSLSITTKLLAVLLAIAIAIIVWLKISNDKVNSENEVLTAKLNAYDVAFKSAQQQQADLERKLRLTEQDAAREGEQSRKRMDETMNKKITGGCEGAIQFGIEQALLISRHQ